MRGSKLFSRQAFVATAFVSTFSLSGLLFAQSEIATEEVRQRSEAVQAAYAVIEKGDRAYESRDFNEAVSLYREALGGLPPSASHVAELRDVAIQQFSQAAVEQARIFARSGDYASANDLLDQIEQLNEAEGAVEAREMRAKILDPSGTNPANTPEHTANIDQVRRLLYEAHGYLDLGQFDRAEMTLEDVLRLDAYNKAARRGMERVQWYRIEYSAAAKDDTRAAMLGEVEAQWESKSYLASTLPQVDLTGGKGVNLTFSPLAKLKAIQIPSLDLADASLEEAIDYLRSVAVERDNTNLGSAKGVDFLLQLGSEDHPLVQEIRKSRIDLQLKNVPLETALKYICEATATRYRIDEFAVVIQPLGVTDQTLVRREFRVPPDFLTRDAINQGAGSDDPFADEDDNTGGLIAKKFTALEKLKSMGVPFPDGTSASYNSGTSSLIVLNTVANLDLVAQFVEALLLDEPIAVIVRTTIVEIEENNVSEITYDTILNSINTGGNLYLAGGSVGNGSEVADMIPGAPVTSGNRSGDEGFSADSLDNLLKREPITTPATRSTVTPTISGLAGVSASNLLIPPPGPNRDDRAPGVLSLQAVIDDQLHQMLFRGLDGKQGIDLMTRPEVITRSGQNAIIKSVREVFYPDEYEPPELPNSVGGSVLFDGLTGQVLASSSPSVPITPATPTSFLETNIGVTLEVAPTVSADRKFIDVTVRPQIRELLGFVNYGTPITGSSGGNTVNSAGTGIAGLLGINSNSSTGVLTENAILKPLIRNIEESTTVTVADGQTIVIGGQLSETLEAFDDGTPILHHLPYFGRFFKSRGMRATKKNLLIMLQVELVDPAGNPIRSR